MVTAAHYLAWEPAQAERHEYRGGEVFAMAGTEDRHVTLASVALKIGAQQLFAEVPET